MIDDEFMDSLYKYLKAEQEAEENGKQEFTCPLCGGEAFWVRSPYNGHKHSGCRKCGMRVME
jgi:transcription elongation factor Elf1